MAQFLKEVDGPTMIGFEPTVWPACAQCSQAWMLRRHRGVWAWHPDCAHKTATCKLVQA